MSTRRDECARSMIESQSDAHHGRDAEKFDKLPDAVLTSDSAVPGDARNANRKIHGLRWLVICVALYMTCFLYGLDTTIAADIQGPVIEAFGQVEQLAWIGAGFPLGSVCVILLLGSLYNLFNVKYVFISGVVVFELGSALCGAAPTMGALIVGRVIAGAGGSGIYLGSLNYLTSMTNEKERGFYMSLIAACWGLGAVLGPVIGGAFSVSSATWRWAFYINLVIGGVFVPVFFLCLPSIDPRPGVSIRDKLVTIDVVGFILGAGIWVTFLLGFTMAGGEWPWDDGRTITTFAVLGTTLVLYGLQQYFAILTTPARRAFPIHLLRDRTQVLLYIVTAAGTTTLLVVVYYIPIYFQFVNNDDAIKAAVRLLPFVIVAVTFNLLSASFLHMIKVYMLLYVIAGAFLIAGGAPMMIYLNPSTSAGTVYGLTILIAVGAGLSMVTGYAIATMTLNPEDVGHGLSLQNVAQIGGQVIALAVASQIYQSTAAQNLASALAGHGFSDQEIRRGVSGAQSALFEQLNGTLREKAIDAVSQAMALTFVLVPVAGGVMLLTALCMKRERLFGKVVAVGG